MYKKKIPKNQNTQTLKNPKLNKILNETKCVCLYMYSMGGSVIVSHLLIPPSKFKIPISPKKSPVSIFVSTIPLSL